LPVVGEGALEGKGCNVEAKKSSLSSERGEGEAFHAGGKGGGDLSLFRKREEGNQKK